MKRENSGVQQTINNSIFYWKIIFVFVEITEYHFVKLRESQLK